MYALADHHRIERCQTLQPRGQVHGFAHRPPRSRFHHHHTRGNTDTNMQVSGTRHVQRSESLHDFETGTYRAVSLSLVGQRISEESDNAITQALENITFIAGDTNRAGVFVLADDGAEEFGIQTGSELTEACHIAKKNGQLAAFPGILGGWGHRCRCRAD